MFSVLVLLAAQVAAEAAVDSHACDPQYLTDSSRPASECAGIFAPDGPGTLKNKAEALNGLDGSGIGPLWGGGWTEVAVFEDGRGSGLGFHVDLHDQVWSVAKALDGDFVIGIKQSTEVAFYLFQDRSHVTGGQFVVDPNFHGEGFSNARIYARESVPGEPRIALDKTAGPVAAAGAGAYSVPITLAVENLGKEPLVHLQLQDRLDIFGRGSLLEVSRPEVLAGQLSVNPDYDGLGSADLLTGTDVLEIGARAVLRFVATFGPGEETGPFLNVAVASATGKQSAKLVHATDKAEIALPREPEIQLTKHTGPVVETGPGTFTVPVSLTLENAGNEKVTYVQIADNTDIFGEDGRTISVNNVRSESGGFRRLTLNPGFDGLTDIRLLAGTDSLEVGKKARVSFDLEFTCQPGSGPFENVAEASAKGANSRQAAGAFGRAEIVCPAEPPEPPVPGIELSKVAGEATVIAPGEFAMPITLTVTNTGNEDLTSVQIVDDLQIFAGGGSLLGVSDLTSQTLAVNIWALMA